MAENLTFTDDGFICHVCGNDKVPDIFKWLQHGKDICTECMFKSMLKNVDGSEINWNVSNDSEVTING